MYFTKCKKSDRVKPNWLGYQNLLSESCGYSICRYCKFRWHCLVPLIFEIKYWARPELDCILTVSSHCLSSDNTAHNVFFESINLSIFLFPYFYFLDKYFIKKHFEIKYKSTLWEAAWILNWWYWDFWCPAPRRVAGCYPYQEKETVKSRADEHGRFIHQTAVL